MNVKKSTNRSGTGRHGISVSPQATHLPFNDHELPPLDNFIVNTSAQAAARMMLSLKKVEEDSPVSSKILKTGKEFICNSCPRVMREMSFEDMVNSVVPQS
jgi:hypothetical protein